MRSVLEFYVLLLIPLLHVSEALTSTLFLQHQLQVAR